MASRLIWLGFGAITAGLGVAGNPFGFVTLAIAFAAFVNDDPK